MKADYSRGSFVEVKAPHGIYIGQMGAKIIVLLCGGDKRNQDDDIKDARAYWADYKYWVRQEERDGTTK